MLSERAREALEVRMGTVMRALAGDEELGTELLWDVARLPGQPNAPAWFSPATRTVSINAVFALQGADPGVVNPLTPAGRRKHPHIIGLGAHEAAHARFTRWGDEQMGLLEAESASVREVVTLLEEPRIERRYLSVRPHDRGYLRAMSVLVDTSQFGAPDDELREEMEGEGRGWVDGWRAATLCLLTLARGDAGVLEPEDLRAARQTLSLVLGDTLERLEPLWREALDLEDGDMAGLVDVARRWVDEVGEKPRGLVSLVTCPGEAPEEPEFADDLLCDDPGVGAVGEGAPDVLSELMETLTEDIGHESQVEADAQEQAEAQAQEREAQRKQQAKDTKDAKKAQEKAQEFFGDPKGASKVVSLAEDGRRDPTDGERQLAVRLAKEIKRARFRERDRVVTLSEVPPGRLQGREAMLHSAQRAMRMPTTARPFRSRRSRYTEEPPLSVGVMTDTSGSMSAFQGFATAFSWACAQAVQGVGQSVSVAYDTQVTVLNAPGECPRQPYPLQAAGSGENWREAFSIVDGALNLTTGSGARLLFVFSDGEYAPAQATAAERAMQRLGRGGVKVIWFSPVRMNNVTLTRIVNAPGADVHLVEVKETFSSVLRTGPRRPKVDQEALAETVLEEITASLRQGLRR